MIGIHFVALDVGHIQVKSDALYCLLLFRREAQSVFTDEDVGAVVAAAVVISDASLDARRFERGPESLGFLLFDLLGGEGFGGHGLRAPLGCCVFRFLTDKTIIGAGLPGVKDFLEIFEKKLQHIG